MRERAKYTHHAVLGSFSACPPTLPTKPIIKIDYRLSWIHTTKVSAVKLRMPEVKSRPSNQRVKPISASLNQASPSGISQQKQRFQVDFITHSNIADSHKKATLQ